MTFTSFLATVEEHHVGLRLDKFLSLALPDISRSRLQNLVEAGAVTLGTKPMGSATYKVKLGESFTLTMPDVVALALIPSHTVLDVVYEDDDILIINKPPGMTVHPAAGTREDTLVHALLGHCGASLSGIGGVARPGIVHRIDKDTSGLLAVAKNDAAHQHLSAQLKSREMKRTYMAFVWGTLNPKEGTVDAPIARHRRFRQQMAIVEGGKEAVTHYETLAAFRCPGTITPLATKVMCNLDTGRTHQIRVHMAHMKTPIMGDNTYGATTTTRLNRLKSGGLSVPEAAIASLHLLNRQALHAAELVLIHPKTNESMHFACDLPTDLVALETALAALTK